MPKIKFKVTLLHAQMIVKLIGEGKHNPNKLITYTGLSQPDVKRILATLLTMPSPPIKAEQLRPNLKLKYFIYTLTDAKLDEDYFKQPIQAILGNRTPMQERVFQLIQQGARTYTDMQNVSNLEYISLKNAIVALVKRGDITMTKRKGNPRGHNLSTFTITTDEVVKVCAIAPPHKIKKNLSIPAVVIMPSKPQTWLSALEAA